MLQRTNLERNDVKLKNTQRSYVKQEAADDQLMINLLAQQNHMMINLMSNLISASDTVLTDDVQCNSLCARERVGGI